MEKIGKVHVQALNLVASLRPHVERVLQCTLGMAPLADKGLAHWHVRLNNTGLLARIPKQSQMGLKPLDNLAYEAACFARAAASGHVPVLHHVIAPADGLPWGALLVEEIAGTPANQPHHMLPIMQALASLHVLPVPQAHQRTPLLSETDPLGGLVRQVLAQSVYLDHPLISQPVRRTITQRLNNLTVTTPKICAGLTPRLITFDAHPGNFLITPAGKAVLVDLEKLRYSYPPLDLAHATLYTSTSWDIEASFSLATAQVAAAYEAWISTAASIAKPYLAAFIPLREWMWLWSVTWCAKWLTESVKPTHTHSAGGEDWSQANNAAALTRHVRTRVEDYLSLPTIHRMLAEFDELGRLLNPAC